jgi:hypothetical protein
VRFSSAASIHQFLQQGSRIGASLSAEHEGWSGVVILNACFLLVGQSKTWRARSISAATVNQELEN